MRLVLANFMPLSKLKSNIYFEENKTMALYVMKEMPDIRKTGAKVLYPSFATVHQQSIAKVAQKIHEASSFTLGDIEGVLKQAGIIIAEIMAEGNSVKIDGLGTFTPALKLMSDKDYESGESQNSKRNARSIYVSSVNFKADKSCIMNINNRLHLERAPWKCIRSSDKYSVEERKALALQYIDKEGFLTVSIYQKITGLLRSAATIELHNWEAMNNAEIKSKGRSSHKIYVKR